MEVFFLRNGHDQVNGVPFSVSNAALKEMKKLLMTASSRIGKRRLLDTGSSGTPGIYGFWHLLGLSRWIQGPGPLLNAIKRSFSL